MPEVDPSAWQFINQTRRFINAAGPTNLHSEYVALAQVHATLAVAQAILEVGLVQEKLDMAEALNERQIYNEAMEAQ